MKLIHRACVAVTSIAHYRLFWLCWLLLHGALVAVMLGGGCGK